MASNTTLNFTDWSQVMAQYGPTVTAQLQQQNVPLDQVSTVVGQLTPGSSMGATGTQDQLAQALAIRGSITGSQGQQQQPAGPVVNDALEGNPMYAYSQLGAALEGMPMVINPNPSNQPINPQGGIFSGPQTVQQTSNTPAMPQGQWSSVPGLTGGPAKMDKPTPGTITPTAPYGGTSGGGGGGGTPFATPPAAPSITAPTAGITQGVTQAQNSNWGILTNKNNLPNAISYMNPGGPNSGLQQGLANLANYTAGATTPHTSAGSLALQNAGVQHMARGGLLRDLPAGGQYFPPGTSTQPVGPLPAGMPATPPTLNLPLPQPGTYSNADYTKMLQGIIAPGGSGGIPAPGQFTLPQAPNLPPPQAGMPMPGSQPPPNLPMPQGGQNAAQYARMLAPLTAPGGVYGPQAPGGGAVNPDALRNMMAVLGNKQMASGGHVPGHGNTDTVPAMLTPGEYVVNADATRQYLPQLQAMNRQHFDQGGYVDRSNPNNRQIFTQPAGTNPPPGAPSSALDFIKNLFYASNNGNNPNATQTNVTLPKQVPYGDSKSSSISGTNSDDAKTRYLETGTVSGNNPPNSWPAGSTVYPGEGAYGTVGGFGTSAASAGAGGSLGNLGPTTAQKQDMAIASGINQIGQSLAQGFENNAKLSWTPIKSAIPSPSDFSNNRYDDARFGETPT